MLKTDFLFVVFAGLAAAWFYLLVRTRRALAAAPTPMPADAAGLHARPAVSVIVPARNESARVLAQAIGSLVAQDYAALEVIVVDDNSTDETRAILERLATAHPGRLRLLAAGPLPEDWFGKVWALEQGRRAAQGELLLATDADVIHHPGSVAAGVALFAERGLDALTLYPRVELGGFWERTVLPVIAWMMIVASPFDRANDAASETSLGCGSFILVRRQALESLGGYGAVRQQVNEDGWTMRLLKRAGYRTAAGDGSALLRTRLYGSLGEIWTGFGKSMFPAVGFRVGRGLRTLILSLLLGPVTAAGALAGLGAAAYGALEAWHAAAWLAWIGMTATALMFARCMRAPRRYVLLGSLGHLVASLILASSTWKIATGRGVEWKGRRLYARGPAPA